MWEPLSNGTFSTYAEQVADMCLKEMMRKPEIVELSGTLTQEGWPDGRVVVVKGPKDIIAIWIATEGPPYVSSAVWVDV